MAECFVNNAEQETCKCGAYVSKEPLQDGRIRWMCWRCGPQLEFDRQRHRQAKTV